MSTIVKFPGVRHAGPSLDFQNSPPLHPEPKPGFGLKLRWAMFGAALSIIMMFSMGAIGG